MPNQLLDEVFRCVESIGYEKTFQILREAQFQEIKFEDKRVEKVVTLVSSKTGVPVHEILFGSGRKNERKFAIGFCAYYLHDSEFFNIPMEDVRNFLHKDNSVNCYIYAKNITRLNSRHIADQKWCAIKAELDQVFAKHKQ